MQAARALGYSLATKEEKVFEKLSAVLHTLLVEGATLATANVSVVLKRDGKNIAHLDLSVDPDGTARLRNVLVDKKFYPQIEAMLAEHSPDHQEVCDFSNITSGLWDLD